MLKLPTNEYGIKDGSTYYLFYPSKTTINNYFYPGIVGHYFVDSQYYFSHNALEEVIWPEGITRVSPGIYSYKTNDQIIEYDMRYIIILPITGSIVVLTDSIYTFTSGQAALIDSMKGHSYFSLGDSEFLFIMFAGNQSDNIASALLEYGNIFSGPDISIIQNLLNDIHIRASNDTSFNDIVLSGTIHYMLSLLYKSIDKKSTPTLHKMYSCREYINEHYIEPLDLDYLAKKYYLSTCHFAREFKNEFGISPHEYILQIRFAVSKKLLATTKESVKEIAFECGFNSDVHYMNMFKKRFGITPTDFRKAYKKHNNL